MEKDDSDSVIGRLKLCLKALGKAYEQDEQLKYEMAKEVGFRSRTFDSWKKPTSNFSKANLVKIRRFMRSKSLPPAWVDWVLYRESDELPSLLKKIKVKSAQSE